MKKLLFLLLFIGLSIGLKAQDKTDQLKTDTTLYIAAQIQPVFPGGDLGFRQFLREHIVYPETDRQNHTVGFVYLQFIIEKDGSLSHVKAIRAPSETLAAEAIRVMNLSPKWIPAKQNGYPVRLRFTVPVKFSL